MLELYCSPSIMTMWSYCDGSRRRFWLVEHSVLAVLSFTLLVLTSSLRPHISKPASSCVLGSALTRVASWILVKISCRCCSASRPSACHSLHEVCGTCSYSCVVLRIGHLAFISPFLRVASVFCIRSCGLHLHFACGRRLCVCV